MDGCWKKGSCGWCATWMAFFSDGPFANRCDELCASLEAKRKLIRVTMYMSCRNNYKDSVLFFYFLFVFTSRLEMFVAFTLTLLHRFCYSTCSLMYPIFIFIPWWLSTATMTAEIPHQRATLRNQTSINIVDLTIETRPCLIYFSLVFVARVILGRRTPRVVK